MKKYRNTTREKGTHLFSSPRKADKKGTHLNGINLRKELRPIFTLTDEQMRIVEKAYLQVRPRIVLSHDAPTDIARFAWEHACQFRRASPGAIYRPSRTNVFLTRLLQLHAPRLWIFGHHHRDWRYRDGETQFICVGELKFVDIDSSGNIL